MKKIFEYLGITRNKKGTANGASTLTNEDYLDMLSKYEQTYRFVEHLLNARLNGKEDADGDGRFRIAPLSNIDEEYLNLFSNPPMDKPARRGKSAYLRDAYHERIRKIVNALNIEGVNISSYVDMVLTDHLMRYEDQIDHLLQNCNGKSRKLAN